MGAGHGHGQTSREADKRWLAAALGLLLAFMVGEVVVGLLAGSLALLTDAAHMLTDAFAIALALVAMRFASRPGGSSYTFGLRRVEILSAQVNGLTLVGLVAFFLVEAVRRLADPPEVDGGLVTITAAVGVAVNLACTWMISRADRSSLAVEGAFQHILNDLFAFVATLVAGIVVMTTGWHQADIVASLVVAALMAWAAWGLLRDSGRIFMEAAPRGMEPALIREAVEELPGVTGVHDLHVWEVTSGFPALSAHVLVEDAADCHERREAIEQLLFERWHIAHTTLQVDHREESSGGAEDCNGPLRHQH